MKNLKKIKAILKNSPDKFNESQIIENSIFKDFLRSKGITTPEKLSKMDIVKHSNSDDYKKWKENHFAEDISRPSYRRSRNLGYLPGTSIGTDLQSIAYHAVKKLFSRRKPKQIKTPVRLEPTMKEELDSLEKQNKLEKTYGKKPKFDQEDKKKENGNNNSTARAVQYGGKTLSDEERDTIEIDPEMRNSSGQSDITKKKDK